MLMKFHTRDSEEALKATVSLVALMLAIMPAVSTADIIWSGGFETGNFKQYHSTTDPNSVYFFQMPEYGRPIQYGGQQHTGNGDLLSLVSTTARTVNGIFYPQGPTRGADYAAKFTVKNSSNGSEPDDCDFPDGCSQRRTQLTMQGAMEPNYGGLSYMSERWIAFSIYLPANYETRGSGFGQQFWEIKPRDDNGSGDCLAVGINETDSWGISHNWQLGEASGMAPTAQQMRYRFDYPTSSSDWPNGVQDFAPGGQDALGIVNRGGWTDWVIHLKFDARGSDLGGTGFLNIWKRDGSAPWQQILAVVPGTTTRMGTTFNHGICTGSSDGFGPKVGPYMKKGRVWNNNNNLVLYIGNHKIGDNNTVFSQMSHDGSSPGIPVASRPNPPIMQ